MTFCHRQNYVACGIGIVMLLIVGAIMGPGQSRAKGTTYRIGPADVLNLTVYAGGEKQNDVDLTVSSEGSVSVPFIGSIQAAGLTPAELEKRITEPLARDYLVNPKVTVLIKEFHSLHYYISGAVTLPGMYEMSSQTSLLALIAKAGGVQPDRGSLAYIMRNSEAGFSGGTAEVPAAPSKPIKVDLNRLLDQGDLSANVMLEPGDMVYIPLKQSLDVSTSKIYVEGEVKEPGVYDFQPGMTALNACILAGGFSRFAAPNRTRIIRQSEEGQEVIKVRLDDVKGGEIADIELKPGDRIHVPETWL